MKLLLKLAIQNKKHLFILIITLVSMLSLTFASQLEMVALGVLSDINPKDMKEHIVHQKQTKEESPSQQVEEKQTEESPSQQTEEGQSEESSQPMVMKMLIGGDSHKQLSAPLLQRIKQVFHLDQSIWNLVIMLFAISIIKASSLFANQFSTQLVSIYISKTLRQKYFEHIQTLPMSFYHKYNIGSLSARVVADAGTIAISLNSFLTNYLQTPFAILSSLIVCFLTSWRLSLVLFIGIPLLGFPITFLARRIKRIAKQMQRNQESFATVLVDFLAGIFTVKVFSMENYSLKKYKEQNEHMARLERKNARYSSSARPVLHFIGTIFLSAVLVMGLVFLEMKISELLMFCGLLWLCYEPIKKFTEENNNIQRGVAAAERMFEVINITPDIKDLPGAHAIKDFDDTIKFDDVWFRYNDEWVLKGVSFEIKKGQTLALVGPTGSGKSTIAQLFPRLYEPQKGEIRIDGTPLNQFTLKSLRETIAFVPQKPFLFLDTIHANISFGRDYSQQEVEAAAHQAHASEFISQLPKKYDTVLSEMGKNLSGGQQQRLAIARALVKKAPILIMDEATSALDAISENYIQQAIEELHGKLTQIIIAHRLSTIQDADVIIYLDQGKIVAQGTRTELLNICPAFKEMWDTMYSKSQTTTVV